MRPQCAGRRGKDRAIRSDVRQECVRLKKLDPVFEPLHKADGRQPFMPHEYLTNPCLEVLSLRLASSRRKRPLSVGRVQERLSSSVIENITRTEGRCQENS